MRTRLDALLVERTLAESRAQAQSLIREGLVAVDGRLEDKPGTLVRADAIVTVRPTRRFVSRGAVKLQGALDSFGLSPSGEACLDVGASTGGFTDLLLVRGARVVYAVDVGRGQLAWRLRGDPRVVNLERTDIRSVDSLPEPIDLVTVDVSFISLRLVLPCLPPLLSPAGRVLALVKPQFEAGRKSVGHGGVIRDAEVHREVLVDLSRHLDARRWLVLGAVGSSITGTAGNREFWLHLTRSAPTRQTMTPEQVGALARATDGSPSGPRPQSPERRSPRR